MRLVLSCTASLLLSCVAPGPAPAPAAEHTRAARQPLTAPCSADNGSGSFWEPVSALTRLPVPLDINDCYAAGLSAAQVTDCFGSKLVTPLHDACIEGAGTCCLSPDEWSVVADHAVGRVRFASGEWRWVLWLQVRRMGPTEAPAVWRVEPLTGGSDLSATVAQSTGDLHPPDCGDSSCPAVSAWQQGPMIAPSIGPVPTPVMAIAWVPAP